MKKRQYDDDDGRTIADMNVEGMPWYRPHKTKRSQNGSEPLDLTRKEKFWMIMGMYRAMFLVLLAFGALFLIVILFLLAIWT